MGGGEEKDFLFMAVPTAYGSSWTRGQIWATAVTYITAAAMPDPLPAAPQWRLLPRVFKPISLLFPSKVYCCHLWYMVSLMPRPSRHLVWGWLPSLWHLVFRHLGSANSSICFLSYANGLTLFLCCSLLFHSLSVDLYLSKCLLLC